MWRTPPSELYAVEDPLAAYYFNRAVATFGTLVDNDREQASEGKSGKQAQMAANMALVRWVPEIMKGQFRSPQATR